jgi:hypothetical protein
MCICTPIAIHVLKVQDLLSLEDEVKDGKVFFNTHILQ